MSTTVPAKSHTVQAVDSSTFDEAYCLRCFGEWFFYFALYVSFIRKMVVRWSFYYNRMLGSRAKWQIFSTDLVNPNRTDSAFLTP